MKRLPREVELQRLEAYTKTSDDDAPCDAERIEEVLVE